MSHDERPAVAETLLTVTYDGLFYATLIVTPTDLEDFAVGFSLSEGVIAYKSEIAALEVAPANSAIELHIKLKNGDRRRMPQISTPGHMNCFCDFGNRGSRLRCLPAGVDRIAMHTADITEALETVSREGPQTSYLAAFWRTGLGICMVREDAECVNAFDKLAGALVGGGIDIGNGFIAVSSRISAELVNKAANMGVGAIVTATAPGAVAIRAAQHANLALVALPGGVPHFFSGKDRVHMDGLCRSLPNCA